MDYDKRYMPVYRCRACKGHFRSGEPIGLDSIETVVEYACSTQSEPSAPPMHASHKCEGSKGTYGIGDLIGFDLVFVHVSKEDN